MANTFTTNYAWTKPEVGADTNAWGTHINGDLDGIDGTLFTVSGVASAALPRTGGVMNGVLQLGAGTVSAPGLAWQAENNTGFYYIASHTFAATVNSSAVLTFGLGGVTANGTLTVTGLATFNGAQTYNAPVDLVGSTAAAAGINISPGVAPTTPQNGDAWVTATGFFIRVNAVTQQMAAVAGTLQAANNLSDVASAATARTNLGVTATGADAAYAARASNLSDLASAPTARTNLGLGTLAVLSAPTFAAAGAFNAGQDYATPLAAPTTTEVGYMGVPQNVQAGSYTLTLADRGKEVFVTANGTVTIPANASVAFPIGSTIVISADASVTALTIAITTDTLRFVPSNATGSRSMTGPAMAVITKKKAAEWWIKGDVT
jgi:hypothetical protein